MYLTHSSTFGTSGIFEQDDTEPWSSMTRIGGSTFARKKKLLLNYKMGHAGIGSSEVVTDFAGPGTVWSNRYEEGVQRNLLWNWVKWMTDDVPDPGSNGRRDLRELNLQLVAGRDARAKAAENGGGR